MRGGLICASRPGNGNENGLSLRSVSLGVNRLYLLTYGVDRKGDDMLICHKNSCTLHIDVPCEAIPNGKPLPPCEKCEGFKKSLGFMEETLMGSDLAVSGLDLKNHALHSSIVEVIERAKRKILANDRKAESEKFIDTLPIVANTRAWKEAIEMLEAITG